MKVPQLRKLSILTVIGSVVLLVLAAALPRLTVVLAVLAILVYSVPFVFWMHVWPRSRERQTTEHLWVRELTPEILQEWYASGRITREDFERMMRDQENRP